MSDPLLRLDTRRMPQMSASSVRYIVIHHSLSRWANVDAAEIHDWHLKRGWAGIGYHRVILDDLHDRHSEGHVQIGRPLEYAGAHTEGINHCSFGICVVGDGDFRPFSDVQVRSLAWEVKALMREADVSLDRVIGHHEVNDLVSGLQLSPAYRTTKSCPGGLNPMDELRDRIALELTRAATLYVPQIVFQPTLLAAPPLAFPA